MVMSPGLLARWRSRHAQESPAKNSFRAEARRMKPRAKRAHTQSDKITYVNEKKDLF